MFVRYSQPRTIFNREEVLYWSSKTNLMFTLDCTYYQKSFPTLWQFIEDILRSGQDPNYEVIYNGEKTGVSAKDLITS